MNVTYGCELPLSILANKVLPSSFTTTAAFTDCFLLFPQGLPISMYGGTLIPSHPQLADGPGGPLFNGLHTPDPAWNPMIKVVQNSTECTDAQQVVWLPFSIFAYLGLFTVLCFVLVFFIFG